MDSSTSAEQPRIVTHDASTGTVRSLDRQCGFTQTVDLENLYGCRCSDGLDQIAEACTGTDYPTPRLNRVTTYYCVVTSSRLTKLPQKWCRYTVTVSSVYVLLLTWSSQMNPSTKQPTPTRHVMPRKNQLRGDCCDDRGERKSLRFRSPGTTRYSLRTS